MPAGFYQPSPGDIYRPRRFADADSASLLLPADPYYANVVSLLNFENISLPSTTPVDAKGKTWTGNGSAAVSNTRARYGTQSGYCDGTSGSYFSTADSNDWYTPGDYTIEISVYFNSLAAGRQWIYGQVNSGAGALCNMLEVGSSSGELKFWYDFSNTLTTATGVIAAGAWYDIQFIKAGSSATLAVNGVSKQTATITQAATNFSGTFSIGRGGDFNGFYSNFYFDEFRHTNGTARTMAAKTAAWPTQ